MASTKYRLCKRLNKCAHTRRHTQTHTHLECICSATADRHIYIKYTLSWVFLSPKKETTTTKLVLKSMLRFWRSGLAYLPLIFACVCVFTLVFK